MQKYPLSIILGELIHLIDLFLIQHNTDKIVSGCVSKRKKQWFVVMRDRI